MLALRPSCEHCNKPLLPNSTEAMICSYECTFCEACVREVLHNVCPNCGGGFCQRPIRPANNLKNNNCLVTHPATNTVTHKRVDVEEHDSFAERIKVIEPENR